MELGRDCLSSSLISLLIGCHQGLLEELIPQENSSLMWNLYFISLFICIWKTGVEKILELNGPSLSAYVGYNTIQLYCTTLKLLYGQHLHYKPVINHFFLQGGRGGGGAMSSCTVLHYCHPVTYKYQKQYIYLIYIVLLIFIVEIYSIQQYLLNHGNTYFVIPSSYLMGLFLIGQPF